MPVTAVTAEVALNFSVAYLPYSVFPVVLATAFWAVYNLSSGFMSELGLRNNLATVRTVYDFLFHVFSPFAK